MESLIQQGVSQAQLTRELGVSRQAIQKDARLLVRVARRQASRLRER